MMHETLFLRLTTEKQQAIWVNVSHITMITTTKKHLTALGILGQRECSLCAKNLTPFSHSSRGARVSSGDQRHPATRTGGAHAP